MKPLNPWDQARKQLILRPDTLKRICGGSLEMCKLERGVNFFILMLEKLGAQTHWSCEGHPTGFYIVFRCPYPIACMISHAGYFGVEIASDDSTFSLRLPAQSETTERVKRRALRGAAESWTRHLTPIIQLGLKIAQPREVVVKRRSSGKTTMIGGGSHEVD